MGIEFGDFWEETPQPLLDLWNMRRPDRMLHYAENQTTQNGKIFFMFDFLRGCVLENVSGSIERCVLENCVIKVKPGEKLVIHRSLLKKCTVVGDVDFGKIPDKRLFKHNQPAPAGVQTGRTVSILIDCKIQ